MNTVVHLTVTSVRLNEKHRDLYVISKDLVIVTLLDDLLLLIDYI